MQASVEKLGWRGTALDIVLSPHLHAESSQYLAPDQSRHVSIYRVMGRMLFCGSMTSSFEKPATLLVEACRCREPKLRSNTGRERRENAS